jgi:hypothetical protein
MTCRLKEARPRTPYALPAPMAHVIALTALAALGLPRAPFHETFHTRGNVGNVMTRTRSSKLVALAWPF